MFFVDGRADLIAGHDHQPEPNRSNQQDVAQFPSLVESIRQLRMDESSLKRGLSRCLQVLHARQRIHDRERPLPRNQDRPVRKPMAMKKMGNGPCSPSDPSQNPSTMNSKAMIGWT